MTDDTVASLIPFIISCLKTPSDNMLIPTEVFISILPEILELSLKLNL